MPPAPFAPAAVLPVPPVATVNVQPQLHPLRRFRMTDGAKNFLGWRMDWDRHAKYVNSNFGSGAASRLRYDLEQALDYSVEKSAEFMTNLPQFNSFLMPSQVALRSIGTYQKPTKNHSNVNSKVRWLKEFWRKLKMQKKQPGCTQSWLCLRREQRMSGCVLISGN